MYFNKSIVLYYILTIVVFYYILYVLRIVLYYILTIVVLYYILKIVLYCILTILLYYILTIVLYCILYCILQSCMCLSFSPVVTTSVSSVPNSGTAVPVVAHITEDKSLLPNIVAGYSDGVIRMFDLNRVEMILKIHPHSAAVSALKFSADGI